MPGLLELAWGGLIAVEGTGFARVTYRPFVPATETLGAGVACDAIGLKVEKREEDAPDGGKVFVVSRAWLLRGSQLGADAVTKRGQVVEADGTSWLVVVEAERKAAGVFWRCETVRL